MKLQIYTFMWETYSTVPGEKYKAALARKKFMKNTMFKEFYQKLKESYVNSILVEQTHPRTSI